VTRIRRFLGAVLIAGSSTQCLLFAESPNVQPEVKLDGPAEVRKTVKATFTAMVSDDQDPRSVRVQWFVRNESCPASVSEAMLEPLAAVGNTHSVTRMNEGAFCLGAIATDAQGASAFAARRFEVVNQPPVANLKMVAPSARITPVGPSGTTMAVEVPLYSEVRLSGAGSEDPDDPQDKLRYQWKVTAPAGAGEPATCGAGSVVADGPEICRRLAVSGDYIFELIVRDGQAESNMVPLTVVVQPDALPCFERTEPPHDLARGADGLPPVVITAYELPYTFRVLAVRDDGDPYPTPAGGSPGSFSWQWRLLEQPTPPPFERLTDTTLTSFTIEAKRYSPGDELEVRVDYRDRKPNRCLDGTAADQCQSPPDSGCFQRVSWRLKFLQ
jgi:hypothetical protein